MILSPEEIEDIVDEHIAWWQRQTTPADAWAALRLMPVHEPEWWMVKTAMRGILRRDPWPRPPLPPALRTRIESAQYASRAAGAD